MTATAGGSQAARPITMFGPDFPFAYDDWVRHPAGLGRVPAERRLQELTEEPSSPS